MSCNILANFLEPKAHKWESRKDQCFSTIINTHADIICMQELSNNQYFEFKNILCEYEPFDKNNNHPLNCIWLKKSNIEFLGNNKLELPNGGPNSIERYLNIVKIRFNNKNIIIANTHLTYNANKLAQIQSKIILDFLNEKFPNDWIILTGDFNYEYNSKVLKLFFTNGYADTYKTKHGDHFKKPTFHAFKSSFNRQSQVDWILTKNCNNTINSANVITNPEPEKYGSDHFFITTTFE
jgi:endonuclease/exonuclease/phosphatase family metal-dependent hydrolase